MLKARPPGDYSAGCSAEGCCLVDISLSEHLRGFLLAVGTGVLLGALYDVLRLFRIAFQPPKAHVFFLDLAYCVVCAFVTFLTALAACKGDLRFYVFAGEGMGWCVYYLALGMITARFFRWFFKKIDRFIWSPLKRLLRWIKRKILGCLRWFGAILKKIMRKLKKSLKPRRTMVYNQTNMEKSTKKTRSKQRTERVKRKREAHQTKEKAPL